MKASSKEFGILQIQTWKESQYWLSSLFQSPVLFGNSHSGLGFISEIQISGPSFPMGDSFQGPGVPFFKSKWHQNYRKPILPDFKWMETRYPVLCPLNKVPPTCFHCFLWGIKSMLSPGQISQINSAIPVSLISIQYQYWDSGIWGNADTFGTRVFSHPYCWPAHHNQCQTRESKSNQHNQRTLLQAQPSL